MVSVDDSLSACLGRWSLRLEAGSDSPRLDAEVLFKYVSGYSDTQLIIGMPESLSVALRQSVDELIESRRSGTPIAYLTGQREFFSIPLSLNSNVLIPRPDTECLVEAALALIEDQSMQSVLDLGTGSGAIALAVAKHAPAVQLTATDRLPAALEVATANAAALGLSRIAFVLSHWYQDLPATRYDLIISNPPYIDPQDAHLKQGDLRFEPMSALVAGEQGLADLRQIIEGANAYLNSAGYLIVEHGCDQAGAVRELFSESGFIAIKTLQDYSLNDRLTMGRYSA